jgi:hypothetical protein
MKKLIGIVIVIIAILATVFASVKPVNFYDTLRGMKSVAEGAPGTFAYAKGNLIVMSWAQGAKYAFTVVTRDGSVFDDLKKLCNGNMCNWQSIVEFTKWLEGQGFQRILPEALPVGMVTTLSGWGTIMVMMGKVAIPNIFVLPVGVMEMQPAVATGVAQ